MTEDPRSKQRPIGLARSQACCTISRPAPRSPYQFLQRGVSSSSLSRSGFTPPDAKDSVGKRVLGRGLSSTGPCSPLGRRERPPEASEIRGAVAKRPDPGEGNRIPPNNYPRLTHAKQPTLNPKASPADIDEATPARLCGPGSSSGTSSTAHGDVRLGARFRDPGVPPSSLANANRPAPHRAGVLDREAATGGESGHNAPGRAPVAPPEIASPRGT